MNHQITFIEFETFLSYLYNFQDNEDKLPKLNNVHFLSLDFLIKCFKNKKTTYHTPKLNLFDLGVDAFLDVVIGDIEENQMIILITHESYQIKKCFKGNWGDVKSFCKSYYENFNIDFVQEHDYIFFFIDSSQLILVSHDKWVTIFDL